MKMYELIIIKKWISLYTKDFVLKFHIKIIIIFLYLFLRLPCNYNLLKSKEMLLNTEFFLRFMLIYYIIKLILFVFLLVYLFALYYFINNHLILIKHFLIRNQCFLIHYLSKNFKYSNFFYCL